MLYIDVRIYLIELALKNNKDKLNKIERAGLLGWLEYLLRGHIFNWFWRSRSQRKIIRETVHQEILTRELNSYIPFIKSLNAEPPRKDDTSDNDKIFTLWLQGEDYLPPIVKACIDSVRRYYPANFILIEENNLKDYIELPPFILEKWHKKEMIAAHFADIVRIELLHKYGGYWIDATCFMTGKIPKAISDSDFVMLMANGKFNPYMFVQNCFIRAKKGSQLLSMWRQLVLEYWKNDGDPLYYFNVQILFKLLVTYNEEAAGLFEKMIKIPMDPTHYLWYEIGDLPYDEKIYHYLVSQTFFQKCTYKHYRKGRKQIIPGSMIDVIFKS